MKLACPSCHHPIEVLDLDAELSAQMSCADCGAVVGITVTVSILSAGAARDAAPTATRVVVAMTDRDLRSAYAEALAKAGFAVTETSESRQTLQMLGRAVPDVAVVDGSFPAIFGMGIGEIIKKSNVTRDTRVLGLRTDAASPLPVPGADRTVAVTVGIDTIVREVEGLAAARASAAHAAPPTPAPTAEAVPPPVPAPSRVAPEAAPAPPKAQELPAPAPELPTELPPELPTTATPASPAAHAAPPAPPAPQATHAPPSRRAAPAPPSASASAPAANADPEHAAAQRLARIIISDTALYNQPAVEAGIRSGRLRETLMPLLQEGRHHYEERTPPHVRADTDYLEAALEQFVARKMKAMKPAAV